jgi:1-deoxy-D-xylulose-5-phosphate synthase
VTDLPTPATIGPLLTKIGGPRDLKALPSDQLPALAEEIRDYLVAAVSQTGGHLGPNLGVVELTMALHRVFNSPDDAILFDTGHQAYVHKLLTGRQNFSTLRRSGGLSGYPSRTESVHDVIENTHASTGLSWALGIAQARQLTGQGDRYTVVVVGDGALTGGMSWEALNNIALEHDLRLVIVVNDNGRSYAPTIGGLAAHLAGLRTSRRYERTLNWGRRFLLGHGWPGRLAYSALHGLKKGIKDMVAPQGLFEDLGIKYIGAVKGHDINQLIHSLERAKAYGGPVIVHTITEKGRGYRPAEHDGADRFHTVGRIHPTTGLPLSASGATWTAVFADELVRLARADQRIVALTAAMLEPVGLARFAAEFPSRVFDVGIAEQHAVTTACGMAFAGLRPVVPIYASFANRAFDQILMDGALHEAPITLVFDRAGLTGQDGPSHNGQWDLAMLRLMPGIRVAAPRDALSLRETLVEALAHEQGPNVIRFPKGEVVENIPAIRRENGIDVLCEFNNAVNEPDITDSVLPDSQDRPKVSTVLLVAYGPMAGPALVAAKQLTELGLNVQVVDPRWVLPVNDQLVRLAAACDLVVTIEDGLASGGVGEALMSDMAKLGLAVPVRCLGVPSQFLPTASRAELISRYRLDAAAIVQTVQSIPLMSPNCFMSNSQGEQ